MKTVLIVILCGVVAIPIVSGILYGFNWEVWSFLGIVAALGLVIIIVNKVRGTRPF
jgi:hypothetical protein